MQPSTIVRVIRAAGLDPADYQVDRAAHLLTETIHEMQLSEGDHDLTTADLWEVLGGDRDESIPRSDRASEQAWEVADALNASNGYGGYLSTVAREVSEPTLLRQSPVNLILAARSPKKPKHSGAASYDHRGDVPTPHREPEVDSGYDAC